MTNALSPLPDSTHIVSMAKGPERPRAPHRRDPAKHSRKDPAKPTRAKAARPETPALDPSLADLLNPGIGQGRAGIGAQTGIKSSAQSPSDPSPHPGGASARPSASLMGEGSLGIGIRLRLRHTCVRCNDFGCSLPNRIEARFLRWRSVSK